MATAFYLQKIGCALLLGGLLAQPAHAEPAFRSTDVEWTHQGHRFFGTLVETAAPPRAGVLWIAGSGPTDRNWESNALQGDNGSARLLAQSLGNVAIASMRFDKLGSGKTGVPESFLQSDFRYSPEDYLAEVEGALLQLKTILPKGAPVFLAGHSEGGLWALEFNRRRPGDFAGVILIATAGRSQCEVVQAQLADRLKEYGMAAGVIEKEMGLFEKALDHIAKGEAVPVETLPSLGAMKSLIRAYSTPQSGELGQWICGTNPLDLLPRDSQHLLILQGGYDQQVDPIADAHRLHQAAKGSRYILAPQADHVLKHLDLKGRPLNILHTLKYNQADRSIDPILNEALLQWLDQQLEP